jgi:hypothetical protein
MGTELTIEQRCYLETVKESAGSLLTVLMRMAGRGLITGGLMLCGWLAASSGHAYASAAMPPSAPHAHEAGVLTSLTTAGSDATESMVRPVVHLTGIQHPASTLLAGPSFPGAAGVGAGNHAAAAAAGQTVTALASSVTDVTDAAGAATTRAATSATSVTSGPVGSLTSGLRTVTTDGHIGGVTRIARVTGVTKTVGTAASPVLRLPKDGIAAPVSTIPDVMFTGPRSVPPPAAISAITSQTMITRPQAQPGRPGTHAVKPNLPGGTYLSWQTQGQSQMGYAVQSLRRGRHHRRTESAGPRGHRRPAPSNRPTSGTATQTDPTSSGGGAGAAQVVAQGPPQADSRNPAGRLVRRSVSRWPVGRLGANDPAVSPD